MDRKRVLIVRVKKQFYQYIIRQPGERENKGKSFFGKNLTDSSLFFDMIGLFK